MKVLLIILTIIICGLLGGIVNAIRTDKQKNKYWVSIVKGVVAAFLVPVFLEIIRSDIGRSLKLDLYDYLIFGGLCLVAAIFSDKFIDSIGDKILQKAENAERKAIESNDKANMLIDKNADKDERDLKLDKQILKFKEFREFKKPIPKISIEKVINCLKSENFKFRTITGISKETNLRNSKILEILLELQNQGLAKSFDTGKKILWTINDYSETN